MLRPLAFGCGTALAVSAALILMVQNPSLRKPAEELHTSALSRSPGSFSPPHDPCNDLYRLICHEKGVTRDPTGSVRPDVDGERQAIEVYENILQQHPDYTPEQLDEALAQAIYTPRNRSKLEAVFHWVRHTMEKFIDSQLEGTLNAHEKKQLKHRLRQIELQMPPPISVYEDAPDLLIKNDVFYERLMDGKMRLRVGGAYFFTARSWFNMVFTLAHELAHSIDPCELRSARLSLPAYDRIGACFMERKLVDVRKNRFECGRHDQLSETFADWMAVHVTVEALKSYATEFHGTHLMNSVVNSVRDLCEQEDEGQEWDNEYHPSPQVRIDQIFGRNPKIREILGCATPPQGLDYCTFESHVESSIGPHHDSPGSREGQSQ